MCIRDRHPRLLAEFIFIGKQVAGISGNRGKRSAQIMGNGPKKVSPKLLLFNLHGRLGGLPGIFLHPGGQDVYKRQVSDRSWLVFPVPGASFQ